MSEYLETTVDKFTFRVRLGYAYSEAGVWADYEADTRHGAHRPDRLPPAVERRRGLRRFAGGGQPPAHGR